jgi:trehalose 6-phosphate synthase
MPREERIARWRALMDGVLSQDVTWWCREFREVLAGVPMPSVPLARPLAAQNGK